MDRTYREDALARLHPGVRERSSLAGLSREYSLEEIAILTRAGPARALGLERKGHLAPGADADVVLYNPSADVEAMFASPVAVVKGGVVVARDGEIVQETRGRTLRAAPPRTPGRPALERMIRDRFEAVTTLPFEDFPLPGDPPEGTEAAPATPR